MHESHAANEHTTAQPNDSRSTVRALRHGVAHRARHRRHAAQQAFTEVQPAPALVPVSVPAVASATKSQAASKGLRFRTARRRAGVDPDDGMSQSMLAQLVSSLIRTPFHQTRLSRLEGDLSDPTLDELYGLAVATNHHFDWLALGIGDGEPLRDLEIIAKQQHALQRLVGAERTARSRRMQGSRS